MIINKLIILFRSYNNNNNNDIYNRNDDKTK